VAEDRDLVQLFALAVVRLAQRGLGSQRGDAAHDLDAAVSGHEFAPGARELIDRRLGRALGVAHLAQRREVGGVRDLPILDPPPLAFVAAAAIARRA
jgi:hypothetical protein